MFRFEKKLIFRSRSYLDFVKTLPCLANTAQCQGDIVAHHPVIGGKSLKGPDLYALPLCHYHHNEHDQIGKVSFYRKYNLDMWRCVAQILAIYVEREVK